MLYKIMFMNVQKMLQAYSLFFGNLIEQSILLAQHPPQSALCNYLKNKHVFIIRSFDDLKILEKSLILHTVIIPFCWEE